MLPTPEEVEKEYVNKIYSRLASYVPPAKPGSLNTRLCPAAARFISSLPSSSLVVDIGCGETKYEPSSGFLLGVDPCSEILERAPHQTDKCDVALADAMDLPFRDSTADAVLLVSVLHHFASASRRRAVLNEMQRVMSIGAKALIVVWAHEQPYATFPSQDVLVPWNLHEIALNGRLPKIRFHKDSTKEQRIIQNSIPISIRQEDRSPPSVWMDWIVSKVKNSPTPSLPSSTPHFLPVKKRQSLLTGIRRWSPSLGKRLSSLMIPIEEELAEEMSGDIMRDALSEAMATIREVVFYRYYHVFRRGEMESLLSSLPSLRVVSETFENGNWNVVVEKIDANRVL
ncbi:hypothetical protein PFISCL1PPCAC_9950 [Pristionchus fissidentatus]|uniref:Methyltransferase type 11 domain-containing protein n=1 Tax=Pristionchus fissidentatus TaxID=1538716 RepID=A0AAV5VK65_9BILA|nr:hypothetical protein PFISCL1PPCAC_9950 [Pristionchus fissidentatus]